MGQLQGRYICAHKVDNLLDVLNLLKPEFSSLKVFPDVTVSADVFNKDIPGTFVVYGDDEHLKYPVLPTRTHVAEPASQSQCPVHDRRALGCSDAWIPP